MKRLVLIGNGFDLAHGLHTSYADFINWYWDQRMRGFQNNHSRVSEDPLCHFKIKYDDTWNTFAFAYSKGYFNSKTDIGKEVIHFIINNKQLFSTTLSPLLERIIDGIESKTWAGIEQDYYDLLVKYALEHKLSEEVQSLNNQLDFLKEKLIEYLIEASDKQITIINSIQQAIFDPIKEEDVAIANLKQLQEHKSYWEAYPERNNELFSIVRKYGHDTTQCEGSVHYWRKDQPNGSTKYPYAFLLPKDIMLLNFNYTHTAQIYRKNYDSFEEIHIHGTVDTPNSIIFGYGDELDDRFKELKTHKNNECLANVKSIRYLEASNYRKMLSFIESAPFQVLIMGHSCGMSDRTLLNTVFEHSNCISIKPYYYKKDDDTDNYIELVQNISRNFNDMKLMRDRVVNKTQCEPLVK